MGTMASHITSLTIVYSTVYLSAYQSKHQSSASLDFCAGNSPWTGEFPKWPVTRKMFPFDDVVMMMKYITRISHNNWALTGICVFGWMVRVRAPISCGSPWAVWKVSERECQLLSQPGLSGLTLCSFNGYYAVADAVSAEKQASIQR